MVLPASLKYARNFASIVAAPRQIYVPDRSRGLLARRLLLFVTDIEPGKGSSKTRGEAWLVLHITYVTRHDGVRAKCNSNVHLMLLNNEIYNVRATSCCPFHRRGKHRRSRRDVRLASAWRFTQSRINERGQRFPRCA